MANEYSTVIFRNDSYNITVLGGLDDKHQDDDEFNNIEEDTLSVFEELDIFDDEHPWDSLHERSFRHYPEIWLYGYKWLGFDET